MAIDYCGYLCKPNETMMNTKVENYLVRTAQVEWKPLIEKGISYTGIFVKSLRSDPASGRSSSILLKFEAGASYPYHNHPAGEELFVLEGAVTVADTLLKPGDYLYTPPGFKHAVASDTGCVILFVVPEEVVIL